jgi:hypothetical protein
MKDYKLSKKIAELEAFHRSLRDKRQVGIEIATA